MKPMLDPARVSNLLGATPEKLAKALFRRTPRADESDDR